MSFVFEWDSEKARANDRKHGIPFSEAATAFGDPYSITIADPDHSAGEVRFLTLGMSHRQRLVVVAHADRGDVIRIISARAATRAERRTYEEET